MAPIHQSPEACGTDRLPAGGLGVGVPNSFSVVAGHPPARTMTSLPSHTRNTTGRLGRCPPPWAETRQSRERHERRPVTMTIPHCSPATRPCRRVNPAGTDRVTEMHDGCGQSRSFFPKGWLPVPSQDHVLGCVASFKKKGGPSARTAQHFAAPRLRQQPGKKKIRPSPLDRGLERGTLFHPGGSRCHRRISRLP